MCVCVGGGGVSVCVSRVESVEWRELGERGRERESERGRERERERERQREREREREAGREREREREMNGWLV